MYNIIGISGKKQSGKNTVASIMLAINLYYKIKRSCYAEEMIGKKDLVWFVTKCLISNYAEYVQDKSFTNADYRITAFARPLKEAVALIFGINVEDLEDQEFKESDSPIKSPTGRLYTWREILQKFGTEVGRAISPDFWIEAFLRNYKNTYSTWIVSDVRFKTEAEAIKSRGGFLIRVNRDTGSTDDHPSEIDLDDYQDFNVIIYNDGSLSDLINAVHNIMINNHLI